MADQHRRISRRSALALGLGGAAAAVGGALLPRSVAGAPEAADAADSCVVTPAVDEGPFFPRQRPSDSDADLTRVAGRSARADGDVIVVHGRVMDAACNPIAGAVIDVWQANRHGRYDHEADPNPAPLDPNFQGSAHLTSAEDGSYRIRTIMPGAYPASPDWDRPPHLHFKVARRGYHEMITQMLFAGHELNAADRLLQSLDAEEQEHVLVTAAAERDAEDDAPVYTFDLVLREVV
jgi:protocatechuate 3,4-dioxygenase beta subunit